jgi:hypothetical protein
MGGAFRGRRQRAQEAIWSSPSRSWIWLHAFKEKLPTPEKSQPIPINTPANKILLISSTLITEGVINALSMLSLHMHDISRIRS